MADGNTSRTGVANPNGAKFIGGGQQGTDYAASHFLIDHSHTLSTVNSCSFVQPSACSPNLDSSSNLAANHNTFLKAHKYTAIAASMQDYRFTIRYRAHADLSPRLSRAINSSQCKDEITSKHLFRDSSPTKKNSTAARADGKGRRKKGKRKKEKGKKQAELPKANNQ